MTHWARHTKGKGCQSTGLLRLDIPPLHRLWMKPWTSQLPTGFCPSGRRSQMCAPLLHGFEGNQEKNNSNSSCWCSGRNEGMNLECPQRKPPVGFFLLGGLHLSRRFSPNFQNPFPRPPSAGLPGRPPPQSRGSAHRRPRTAAAPPATSSRARRRGPPRRRPGLTSKSRGLSRAAKRK